VAIKVLREELASDPERLRRFEQEARSASALNHPNIITIHDIGKHESTPYIAMEFVEGKTLRETLSEGPLPTKKRSIAVLPFDNMSADPEQEYFCDGMAEEIINALTQVKGLRVMTRTSAFAFKGKSLDIR
jgi:serine/threonine protein kinase